MSMSNFSNGFPGGVTIRGIPLQQTNSGQVYWVNNSTVLAPGSVGGSNGNKGTYLAPFSTLDYAVGRCTAGRGDIIIIMPSHAETLSTATALALDIADIAVIGLGSGTKRPLFTLDTATTVTVVVSAANITLKNLVFSANFADIAELFNLTTAKNFNVEDCRFQATATNMNFIEIVDTNTTDNAADGLTFTRCEWVEPDLATVSFIKGDADITGLTVQDCYFNLGVNASDLPILVGMATGKDLRDVQLLRNRCFRLNDANPLLVVTDTGTANTGIIADNFVRHADTAGELLVTTTTNIGFFNNYATAVADLSGFILPAIDA